MPFSRVTDLVDPIEAVNLNQYAAAFEGDAGAGKPITLTALNDSTSYALRVANQDTTNGRAFKVFKANLTDAWIDVTKNGVSMDLLSLVHQGSTPNAPGAGLTLIYPKVGGLYYREGAAGAETQIITGTLSSFVTLTGTQTLTNKTLTSPTINTPTITGGTSTAKDKGAQKHNVLGYGVVGDGTLANMTGDGSVGWTGTDNTAAFQAAIDAAAAGTNGVSKTVYVPYGIYMSGPLDFSAATGVTFEGDGAVIIPNASAHNKHFIDVGDAGRIRFIDVVFGSYVQSLNITPKTILFMGQSAASSGNAHYWKGSSFIGRCSVAVVYNYGHPSSKAIDCFFQGYGNGVPVMYWTATNAASQTSDNITVTSGLQSTTDWSFLHCEVHEEAAERNEWYAPDAIYEASTAWAWEFEGACDIRVYGGNIGANGARYVRFTDTGAAFTCKSIRFDGTTFYAQDPAGVTTAVAFEVAASSTVEDLVITGASRVDATGQIIKLGSAAALTRPVIGPLKIYGGATSMVSMASGNGTLTDASVECQGLAISVGSGGTRTRGIYRNTNSVTESAAASTAVDITTGGIVRARGGLSVGLTPSASGAMRLTNNDVITQAKASGGTGGSGDAILFQLDTNNDLNIGMTTTMGVTRVRGTTGLERVVGSHTVDAVDTGGHARTGLTALSGTDITLAAGWGSTGAVSSVTANDIGGTFTITPSGSGIGSNPDVTITFKNAYGTQPRGALVQMNFGAGAANTICFIQNSGRPSTTTLVFSPLFTPVSGTAYGFSFQIIP